MIQRAKLWLNRQSISHIQISALDGDVSIVRVLAEFAAKTLSKAGGITDKSHDFLLLYYLYSLKRVCFADNAQDRA